MWEKILEKLIDGLWEWICKFGKILILGYDRVEVIQMNKAISNISLRVDEHLKNRQRKFIIMNYFICMIISILFKNHISELIVKLVEWIENELQLGKIDATEIAFINIIFVLLVIHTIVWVYLTEIFNNHLYGYYVNKRKLKSQIKYCKSILIENVLWYGIEIFYLITANNRVYWFFIILLSIITMLRCYILIINRGKVILEVDVRERGYINKKNKSIDGEHDICIEYINGTKEEINVFLMNLYIVENGDILLVQEGLHKVIERERIRKIVVNNHSDVYLEAVFDEEIRQWKCREDTT